MNVLLREMKPDALLANDRWVEHACWVIFEDVIARTAPAVAALKLLCSVTVLAIIRKRSFLNIRPGGQGEPGELEAKVVEVAVG